MSERECVVVFRTFFGLQIKNVCFIGIRPVANGLEVVSSEPFPRFQTVSRLRATTFIADFRKRPCDSFLDGLSILSHSSDRKDKGHACQTDSAFLVDLSPRACFK